jgi:hypothetical protein
MEKVAQYGALQFLHFSKYHYAEQIKENVMGAA